MAHPVLANPADVDVCSATTSMKVSLFVVRDVVWTTNERFEIDNHTDEIFLLSRAVGCVFMLPTTEKKEPSLTLGHFLLRWLTKI